MALPNAFAVHRKRRLGVYTAHGDWWTEAPLLDAGGEQGRCAVITAIEGRAVAAPKGLVASAVCRAVAVT